MQSKTSSSPTRRTSSSSFGSKPRSPISRTSSSLPRSGGGSVSSSFGSRPRITSSGASRLGGGSPRSGGGSSTRPSFSGGRSGGFGSNSPRRSGGGGRRGPKSERIDENKYINKAVNKADSVYNPKHTFKDFNIHATLAKNIIAKGFTHPSPIQDQAIPVALTGRDIIGIASTGTGKTAAFLIPIINKLVSDKNYRAIVLAPTRELAQQIETEFKAFTFGMRLYSVSCVGGSPIGKQMRELERGVHVVIGTPGRVMDLIDRKKIYMEDYHAAVLDEADRMLDMGFVHDMRSILGLMPKEKQGFFFSATLSPEIRKLCSEFLNDPVSVTVASRDTASSVNQDVVRIEAGQDKIDVLHDLLIKPEFSKVLIFREMKREVDSLQKELKDRGFVALALHGDMRNRERERAVKALSDGDAHVVIATDVAARGIDIPDITHVINYDVPSTYDTYIHRIGRTGRGNKTGTALTFIHGMSARNNTGRVTRPYSSGNTPRRSSPSSSRSSSRNGNGFRYSGR